MKIKKYLSAVLAVLICVTALTVTAMAGNTLTGYNTTVGSFNGSGYSGTQTKATSGANGKVVSTSVGGSYKVDVRQQKSDGTANGAWYRDLDDGTDTGFNVGGHVDQTYNSTVRMQFSNDLTTPVSVQVVGEWCSQ
jgi:hypothetical protein